MSLADDCVDGPGPCLLRFRITEPKEASGAGASTVLGYSTASGAVGGATAAAPGVAFPICMGRVDTRAP